MDKIKTLDEICKIVAELRQFDTSKQIVQCHGVFDLIHPGHIKHFEAAKQFGDILIVTITPDDYVNKGPGRPVFNQRLRAESIAALACIDYVVIDDSPVPFEIIRKIKPNVYVKGKEYEDTDNDITGEIKRDKLAVEEFGGKIKFTDEISFSSTEILNRQFAVYPPETNKFLEEFREKYSASDVIDRLKALSKMKVLVIGDVIIDQYCYCSPLNKSPKEYIIPTKYLYDESYAGGVLATANHIAGFCDNVMLVSCLGTGNLEGFISSHLKSNIIPKFFHHNNPTIVKKRFVEPAFFRKMFEICYMEDTDIDDSISYAIIDFVRKNINTFDLVVANDFGHGLIREALVKVLCDESKFLAINSQTNSANYGFNFVTKYSKADFLCISDPELRLACREKFIDSKILMGLISDKMLCDRVLVTHSKYGIRVFHKNVGFWEIPILSNSVIDTVGAGDAVLSITSPLAALGAPMDMIGFVGNAVGALKVRIVGNKESVESIQLFKFITALLK